MSITISFANHKGGVGKTTSAVNFAFALSNAGKKVLLIDLDPQSNATASLKITPDGFNTSYHLIMDKTAIYPVRITPTLYIVPSEVDLAYAEIQLSPMTAREYLLKESIKKICHGFEYIIIDCPPALGLLTVNALAASDKILIPIECEVLSVYGLSELLNAIYMLKTKINPGLTIAGMFLTKYNSHKILSKNLIKILQRSYDEYMYSTTIRDNVALAEAPGYGKSIFDYMPGCNGAEDYRNLCNEFIKREKINVNV